jgi:hypothetical protein
MKLPHPRRRFFITPTQLGSEHTKAVCPWNNVFFVIIGKKMFGNEMKM